MGRAVWKVYCEKKLAIFPLPGNVSWRIFEDYILVGKDILRRGERFGIIRFGSRVDVYVDSRFAPLVTVGQKSVAGETVFIDASSSEAARTSEVR